MAFAKTRGCIKPVFFMKCWHQSVTNTKCMKTWTYLSAPSIDTAGNFPKFTRQTTAIAMVQAQARTNQGFLGTDQRFVIVGGKQRIIF